MKWGTFWFVSVSEIIWTPSSIIVRSSISLVIQFQSNISANLYFIIRFLYKKWTMIKNKFNPFCFRSSAKFSYSGWFGAEIFNDVFWSCNIFRISHPVSSLIANLLIYKFPIFKLVKLITHIHPIILKGYFCSMSTYNKKNLKSLQFDNNINHFSI